MLKFCNCCQSEKSIDEFNYKNKEKQTRQSICKECQKIAKKEHYNNNKQAYIDKASKKKKEIREWWQEHKTQYKCSCGESHPACIEFHHTDDNKEDDVSALFNSGAVQKGLKELDKCIPICSNCHRKLHYNLRNQIVV